MVKRVSWQHESMYDSLIKILQSDGVITSSTDTVFGLLAPLTQAGYDKLNEIKKRSDKPYLILIGNRQKLTLLCDVPDDPKIQSIMDTYWPGPLTIILPAKKNLPAYMKSKEGTIAIRMPAHAGLQKLLAHFDGLFSTSANLAGEPIPCSAEQISTVIQEQIPLLVLDEQHKDECIASTIIDCTGEQIKILRQGMIKVFE